MGAELASTVCHEIGVPLCIAYTSDCVRATVLRRVLFWVACFQTHLHVKMTSPQLRVSRIRGDLGYSFDKKLHSSKQSKWFACLFSLTRSRPSPTLSTRASAKVLFPSSLLFSFLPFSSSKTWLCCCTHFCCSTSLCCFVDAIITSLHSIFD